MMLPPDARPSEAQQSVPRFSLRNKLFAFAFALVVIPGALLGALATRTASAALESQAGRALAREAVHTAEQLAARLRSERQTLASFARQDLMRDLRVGDVDKRVSQALTTLRAGEGHARSFYALDAAGRVVASSDPRSLGDPPAWLRALAVDAAHGERTLGPVDAQGATLLVMTAPLPDPDDAVRVLGTLVAALSWDALTAATRAVQRDLAQQGVAAHVLVCDARGEVLGGVLAPGRAAPARDELAAAARVGAAPDWIAQTETIAGRAALARDLPDWRIVVMQARGDALAPVTSLQRRMAATLGVALLAALALAWAASRRVAQPLAELTGAIRGLARGGARSVPVRGDDELGVLADSFNRMSAELTRAQSELVEAEKFSFVGELAAGVAHEIRTSLGVLKSSMQLLDRSLPADASAESHELAQMIREEVGRLGGVVDDLLTLRPERALRLEPGPLAPILARAVEFARAPASAKGVRLAFEAPAREALVVRAPELLHQAARNLLVNAVQALSEGGRVEVSILSARDGYGGFEVRDDGPGIPEAIRKRIFRPFVTGRAGGVGLGLTFVKRVVHEHRGRITLDSAPGTGTCIRIELPLAEATA
jgi:signal transduction histidine kinase